ncbi:ATP phosphoribosyltransferase regulatory subunit [Thermotoga sp. KOL6]|nr:ATP phosphoribosyltransferase regulatory subunit [Thermotoga sp. KOL6]
MDFEMVVSFYRKASKSGYKPFFVPALERSEAITETTDFFIDRKGNLYSIRSDFTKSILNYRKKHLPGSPVKVWYADFVYRYLGSDLVAEYHLGLEKIPRNSLSDTLEVLEILLETTVKKFTGPLIVEIGHTKVYEDLLEGVPEEIHERILDLIDAKNLAEIEFLSRVKDIDLSKIEKIIEDSIYRRSPQNLDGMDLPASVKEELIEVASFLQRRFKQISVEVDLTLARTVEEYSGIIFIVYDVFSSKLVAAGGEYSTNGEKGVGGSIFLEGKTC